MTVAFLRRRPFLCTGQLIRTEDYRVTEYIQTCIIGFYKSCHQHNLHTSCGPLLDTNVCITKATDLKCFESSVKINLTVNRDKWWEYGVQKLWCLGDYLLLINYHYTFTSSKYAWFTQHQRRLFFWNESHSLAIECGDCTDTGVVYNLPLICFLLCIWRSLK